MSSSQVSPQAPEASEFPIPETPEQAAVLEETLSKLRRRLALGEAALAAYRESQAALDGIAKSTDALNTLTAQLLQLRQVAAQQCPDDDDDRCSSFDDDDVEAVRNLR